ncbi:PAS domain-containing protein [Actinoplanes sichuanensis]|uniref:histidine kinase n=1 Tax=Actinoplanes sichuanensis TaxID=512349 RepID=A0ABW4A3D5_9ACTN|nr:GAF domain-containing sensor histidine kinase [Actinoplanes sichuanensis]BEL05773.1 PAS domain-containing protein [Actinoplanes sichuanensis]
MAIAPETAAGLDARAQRLLGVVQQLSAAHTDQAVRDITRHAARHLLDADGATFVLRDGDQCHYVDEDAIAPLWKGQRFPLSACISGWAMLNRQSVVIPDIYADPRIPHDAYRPTFVRSLIMVPIRARDPIGAIGVYWADQHAAGPDEVALVQALADTTCVAIENVRLINDLETRVRARTAQLERLLSIVSHELRNPLLAVLGTLEILGDQRLPADVEPSIRLMQRNADRMLHIANDLIDLDRQRSGTFTVRPEPTTTGAIARQVADTAGPVAHTAGIHLVIDVADHRITVDPHRICQALINLVTNAIKFSPPGGTVTFTGHSDQAGTSFTVADHGRGIPGGQLERIFEWQAQVTPDTDSRIAHGAGLGLAITQAIVHAHHGTITVHSDPHQGTRFTVHLPPGEGDAFC